jgi:hypothetical protein
MGRAFILIIPMPVEVVDVEIVLLYNSFVHFLFSENTSRTLLGAVFL